ncbi:MAG: F0F1 ATP synthase subunit epsilon [Planctomycetaceae bacterium]
MPIRVIVVTPERTELDRTVEELTLPMYDGELGVQKGRAALIGRLGYGPLRFQGPAGPERYFIDGGFAQVENDLVSVLTARAIKAEAMNVDEAKTALDLALEMPGTTPALQKLRADALDRARGMLRTARH